MSDHSVDKAKAAKININEIEMIETDVQDQALQTAIYKIGKSHPFLGSVLQCMNISFHYMLPTAQVGFDTDGRKWQMEINPYYYCKCLDPDLQQMILLHEMSHITHKHPTRIPFLKLPHDKRRIMNIAADMAINQYLKRLAKGCQQCPSPQDIQHGARCENKDCPGTWIDVKDFYDEDEKTGKKTHWAENKTMEFYYELLLRRYRDMNYTSSCDNCGSPQSQSEIGSGECSQCGEKHKQKLGDGLPDTADQHNWGEGGDEGDMLDATEELIKRAMIKQSMSHSDLPGHIQELLQDIEDRRTELNYKAFQPSFEALRVWT